MQRNDYNLEQSTPAFFIKGPSLFARFVFLAILAIALIVTDSRLHYLKGFRTKLETYLHPLSLMANAPVELYNNLTQNFTAYQSLKDENKVLRRQLLKANADVQAINSLKNENQQLRDLANLGHQIKQKQLLAEVLHASSNEYIKEVVVNRGAAHDVKLGAAVIDSAGVIGQVTRLYPQTSIVTLITNTQMEIPVMVARNGLRAIAKGAADRNRVVIPYLPANVDIQVGDKLVTSGIDQVYPAGYAIGEVEDIDIEPGDDFIRITCKVAGGVGLHRHVIIVSPQIPLVPTPDMPAEEIDEASKDASAKTTAMPYMNQGVIRASN